ncbi:MAG: carboxymuconolactone decarboxylase family protein [Bacteroidetes bacterium]|jgi:AhpD family alkylhydroperoxidase|nr:carboxymuconolactone decarboxylase family protein [Bacteroidota bacterium]
MPKSTPPPRFRTFVDNHPAISDAYEQLGIAIKESGPLDDRTAQLVKIGIAVGMRHEGAVHAHTRKALDAGCTPEELRHAVVLATTTLGFPSMMAAMTWVDDVLEEDPE